jgi:hypothetical protein
LTRGQRCDTVGFDCVGLQRIVLAKPDGLVLGRLGFCLSSGACDAFTDHLSNLQIIDSG